MKLLCRSNRNWGLNKYIILQKKLDIVAFYVFQLLFSNFIFIYSSSILKYIIQEKI
jgi:hypothetical protein